MLRHAFGGGQHIVEHPEDRGRPPYPSVCATDIVRTLLADTGGSTASLDQCRVGCLEGKKPTTFGGTSSGPQRATNLRCNHPGGHRGLKGKNFCGAFNTAAAQVYQPPLNQLLALMFLDRECEFGSASDWKDAILRGPLSEWHREKVETTKNNLLLALETSDSCKCDDDAWWKNDKRFEAAN